MALKVLSALDGARTQCYHFRAIVIAGMGFFTDAYDLFCIPPVSKLLGRLYYDGRQLPPSENTAVNGIALCGTFAGHLFFGWLGDRIGRKRVYGITLMLMIISSIASGFSIGSSPQAVITSLCFFRFWLGFGIGGDYPLSATIMAEYANTRTRGSFMATIFALQGFGILAGSAVAIIVSASFNSAFGPNPTFVQQDLVWRIILMFGAVPALFTYYWRMKMPETARFTALVAKNARQAAEDMSRVLNVDIDEEEEDISRIESEERPFGLFSKAFAKLHGLDLLGTALAWFLVDIAFYSNNLFQKDIYEAVGWLNKSKCDKSGVYKPGYKNPLEEVFYIARAQALIALCGTLPGYLFTVLLIERIGRFPIQLSGFLFMSVFIFVLGIWYEFWKSHEQGFLVIYSLTFFFSNFGPNTTTFIVPAELFPARLRSTCHGISGASGKAGAIIGAFGFLYASQPRNTPELPDCDDGYPRGIGMSHALLGLGIASFFGFLCTLFLMPETKGRSLEESEEQMFQPENEEGFERISVSRSLLPYFYVGGNHTVRMRATGQRESELVRKV
uniref:TSA: Wollemia nobilis Ref_Wollemi_Transcript_13345_1954 transcribed RNA sequence n=1 Tax=Wollemia nobilis TaxID=56998 RepID=A0A0C9S7K2_9CONI